MDARVLHSNILRDFSRTRVAFWTLVCVNVYTYKSKKKKKERKSANARCWAGWKRDSCPSLSPLSPFLSLSITPSVTTAALRCSRMRRCDEVVSAPSEALLKRTRRAHAYTYVHRNARGPSVYNGVSVIRGCLVLRKRERERARARFIAPFLPQAIRARCAKRRSRVPLRDWNAG